MADSVRYGKVGFECDVCGVCIGDIRLLKRCYRCHKDICPLHARWALKPESLRPQFRFSRWEDRFCDVCPDCDEERQREELEREEEDRQRQEELEEEEAKRVIPRCQICGAEGWEFGRFEAPDLPGPSSSCVSIDDDGQSRHNSSVHLLKVCFQQEVYQTPGGGASHHHVTYPLNRRVVRLRST
jgi:hypothetical protein